MPDASRALLEMMSLVFLPPASTSPKLTTRWNEAVAKANFAVRPVPKAFSTYLKTGAQVGLTLYQTVWTTVSDLHNGRILALGLVPKMVLHCENAVEGKLMVQQVFFNKTHTLTHLCTFTF